MSRRTFTAWSPVAAITGGALWTYFGITLALRPARVPGVSFRASTDVLPWLGLGLVLVAFAAQSLSRDSRPTVGALQRWARRLLMVGATLYASGHVLRQLLSGAWEPAVPVGLLLSIAALLLLGHDLSRTHGVPRWKGAVVLASGVCLLAFNDQYVTAWAAVPFGLLWLGTGAALIRGGGGEAAPIEQAG